MIDIIQIYGGILKHYLDENKIFLKIKDFIYKSIKIKKTMDYFFIK